MIDLSLIAYGTIYVARWMRYHNRHPARDYLESMSGTERGQFLARVQFFVDTGRSLSDRQGHWLQPPYADIYEFKTTRHRFFAFLHHSNLYVVSAAPKRNRKAQVSDYETASDRRKDFLNGITNRGSQKRG